MAAGGTLAIFPVLIFSVPSFVLPYLPVGFEKNGHLSHFWILFSCILGKPAGRDVVKVSDQFPCVFDIMK